MSLREEGVDGKIPFHTSILSTPPLRAIIHCPAKQSLQRTSMKRRSCGRSILPPRGGRVCTFVFKTRWGCTRRPDSTLQRSSARVVDRREYKHTSPARSSLSSWKSIPATLNFLLKVRGNVFCRDVGQDDSSGACGSFRSLFSCAALGIVRGWRHVLCLFLKGATQR